MKGHNRCPLDPARDRRVDRPGDRTPPCHHHNATFPSNNAAQLARAAITAHPGTHAFGRLKNKMHSPKSMCDSNVSCRTTDDATEDAAEAEAEAEAEAAISRHATNSTSWTAATDDIRIESQTSIKRFAHANQMPNRQITPVFTDTVAFQHIKGVFN